MRPRQSLIEFFSTFLQFEAEQFSGWVSDPRLRRSMQTCLGGTPSSEHSENFWVLYWYKLWLKLVPETTSSDDRRARSHLAAYLQEACYWAAQRTLANFPRTQYSIPDGFQIAISQVDRVLKGFDPNQGFNLNNYASVIFSNLIRENLRQRQEVDICTPWALLRKISQKRLIEALQATGLTPDTIASYVLAWKSFKTLYVPSEGAGKSSSRKLARPDANTWNAIAALYNQDRREPKGSPLMLEKWLLNCAQAARTYLYPTVASINAPTPGQETGELQDYLPDTESSSILADMVEQQEEQERQSQQAQVGAVIETAIAKLEPLAQQLLQLYYGQGQTQQQMAEQLQIKQYTVSRRLSKARQSLLLALAQWSQDSLHISLNSNLLKSIGAVLEEWLKEHYSHPAHHT